MEIECCLPLSAILLILILDTFPGYDKVWFIGDVFMANSYKQFFEEVFGPDGKIPYIRAHYNITGYFNSLPPETECPNILQRLQALLANAIQQDPLLSKVIIIVLDDNMMDYLDHYNTDITRALGRWVEWIANEFHKIITTHKNNLPSKSHKFKYPSLLWCTIPLHDVYGHYNDYKKIFNKLIGDTIKLFR